MPRNARKDGAETRGWFAGDFPGSPNPSPVELQWIDMVAGQKKETPPRTDCTTAAVLISGRLALKLFDELQVLGEPSDYVLWGPDVPHTWEAEEDSTVFTVRW